jgi:ABC-2 type transport system ATP-binding protein
MDRGKLLALDTPDALMRSVPGGTTLELTTRTDDPALAERVVAALGELAEVERAERLAAEQSAPGELRVRLYVSGDAPLLVAPAAAALTSLGLTLADVKLGIPTLEDVFIDLTGRALR